jgi:hypothetical protein
MLPVTNTRVTTKNTQLNNVNVCLIKVEYEIDISSAPTSVFQDIITLFDFVEEIKVIAVWEDQFGGSARTLQRREHTVSPVGVMNLSGSGPFSRSRSFTLPLDFLTKPSTVPGSIVADITCLITVQPVLARKSVSLSSSADAGGNTIVVNSTINA